MLTATEARIALTEPFEEFGIRFSDPTISSLLRLTGRHISVFSLVCLEMVLSREKDIDQNQRIVIDDDPEPIAKSLLDKWVAIFNRAAGISIMDMVSSTEIFEGLHRNSTEAERQVLYRLATGKPEDIKGNEELDELCRYGILERINGTPVISEPIARFFREGLHLLLT
jgi:hypothetical protein